MSCERFLEMWVGDDPSQRREAERHAADCPACAEQIRFDRTLAGRIDAWKQAGPRPSEALRRRITALADRRSAPVERRNPSGARFWAWAGAAAAIVLGFTILLQSLSTQPAASPLEAAIREVETKQRDYARAIAGLERQAAHVLERAADPSVETEQAALLLAYRDRLTHLDDVIEEVRGFLEQHPGHAGGHTILLAAYEEKDQVLRELLSLRPGESS